MPAAVRDLMEENEIMTECQQIIKELRKATGMNRRQFCRGI